MNTQQEKRAAVLQAAETLFERLKEAENSPVVNDAPKALAAEVDLSLPEIAIILRGLHRGGKIGLLEGVLVGNIITIAPDQSFLQMPHAITRGRSAKITKTRPGQTSPTPTATASEEIEPSIEEALREQIAALEEKVRSQQEAFEKEQGRARRASEEAGRQISGLQATLAETRRTVHGLTRRVRELQPEADRVPRLLAEIAELKGTSVPRDLATTISRITATYTTKEG